MHVKVHKYNNSEPLSLMTVREINDLVLGGTHSVYAQEDEQGMTRRIIQARTKGGVIQGRTLYSIGDNGWINL